jgi:iron complex transport system substrate-binding protein
MDLDPVLTCGVAPIAYFDQRDYGLGPGPWAASQVADIRSIRSTELPLEQVVAERPDLLVVNSYLVEKTRSRLEKLMPVLSPGTGTLAADGWSTALDQVAQALGAEDAARSHVEAVESRLDDLAKKVAAVASLRVATIYGYSDSIGQEAKGPGTYAVLSRLGLRLPDRLNRESGFSVELSLERVDEARDADVLLVADWSSNPNDPTTSKLLASPLFRRLPAVKEGRAIRLDQETTVGAYMLTALSIIPVAEQMTAAILRAAAGKGEV